MLFKILDEETGITYIISAKDVATATKYLPDPKNCTIQLQRQSKIEIKEGLVFKLIPQTELNKRLIAE